MTNGNPQVAPSSEEKYRFAAIIDLSDSTVAWNYSVPLALCAIKHLAQLVEEESIKSNVDIGNFTGDGFLLLADDIPLLLNALSSVIDKWCDFRASLIAEFIARGVTSINISTSMVIRCGVAHGNCREVTILEGRRDFAGPAINLAARCENAGKLFYSESPSVWPERPSAMRCIVITSDALAKVPDKTQYIASPQRTVRFKGCEIEIVKPDGSNDIDSWQLVAAIWPKSKIYHEEDTRSCLNADERIALHSMYVEELECLRQDYHVGTEAISKELGIRRIALNFPLDRISDVSQLIAQQLVEKQLAFIDTDDANQVVYGLTENGRKWLERNGLIQRPNTYTSSMKSSDSASGLPQVQGQDEILSIVLSVLLEADGKWLSSRGIADAAEVIGRPILPGKVRRAITRNRGDLFRRRPRASGVSGSFEYTLSEKGLEIAGRLVSPQ
jgi:predicted transcriptional regulator